MSKSYDKDDQKVIRILQKVGLTAANKISDSLQGIRYCICITYSPFFTISFIITPKIKTSLKGSIWRASLLSDDSIQTNPKTIVTKVANKYLQQNALARIGKITVPVHEDIISEAGILKYLTEDEQCPKSIVKFHRFFQTFVNKHSDLIP